MVKMVGCSANQITRHLAAFVVIYSPPRILLSQLFTWEPIPVSRQNLFQVKCGRAKKSLACPLPIFTRVKVRGRKWAMFQICQSQLSRDGFTYCVSGTEKDGSNIGNTFSF